MPTAKQSEDALKDQIRFWLKSEQLEGATGNNPLRSKYAEYIKDMRKEEDALAYEAVRKDPANKDVKESDIPNLIKPEQRAAIEARIEQRKQAWSKDYEAILIAAVDKKPAPQIETPLKGIGEDVFSNVMRNVTSFNFGGIVGSVFDAVIGGVKNLVFAIPGVQKFFTRATETVGAMWNDKKGLKEAWSESEAHAESKIAVDRVIALLPKSNTVTPQAVEQQLRSIYEKGEFKEPVAGAATARPPGASISVPVRSNAVHVDDGTPVFPTGGPDVSSARSGLILPS